VDVVEEAEEAAAEVMVVAAAAAEEEEEEEETAMQQFNRLRVFHDRGGRIRWEGKYRSGGTERVSAAWVDANVKAFFIKRVARNFGRWCFMPIGRADRPAPAVVSLNGMLGPWPQGLGTAPEVRYRSAEGGGDYCLPYSAASAAHHLGDATLPALLEYHASAIEQHERQMEVVRETAVREGWSATRITSRENVAAFDPLACAEGDVLILHLKETDGAADHAVSVALGWIFDANRAHALRRLGRNEVEDGNGQSGQHRVSARHRQHRRRRRHRRLPRCRHRHYRRLQTRKRTERDTT